MSFNPYSLPISAVIRMWPDFFIMSGSENEIYLYWYIYLFQNCIHTCIFLWWHSAIKIEWYINLVIVLILIEDQKFIYRNCFADMAISAINSKLVFNMNVTLLKYYMIACTSTFCKFNDTFSRKFRRLCIFKNSFHQFGIYLNLKFNNMIFVCMLCTIILVLWPRKFCIYNIIISIWYQLMTSKGDEIHQLRWWNS